MQVTPEAGRDTAKRFGVEYDWDKMVSDPAYNTQMGAAELGAPGRAPPIALFALSPGASFLGATKRI
jgi:hypothetical protein